MNHKQEKALIDRVKEYVEIGWNKQGRLEPCKICTAFGLSGAESMREHNCVRVGCPLSPCRPEHGEKGYLPHARRGKIHNYGTSSWKDAQRHVNWLMDKCRHAGLALELMNVGQPGHVYVRKEKHIKLHADLSRKEAMEFRRWARENYEPFGIIEGTWHPVVQAECVKMNKHATISVVATK